MENFLLASRSFREYLEDGRARWKSLLLVIFDHLDEECECSIDMLTKCPGATYERVRKTIQMIKNAHGWLNEDDEGKKRIEERILASGRKGESKRYRNHMLRGIECLKRDGIYNWDDLREALSKYKSKVEKTQIQESTSKERRSESKNLKNEILGILKLEKENKDLKEAVIRYLDEIKQLEGILESNRKQLYRLSRRLKEAESLLELERKINARLKKALALVEDKVA